jgi:hypothetical protein
MYKDVHDSVSYTSYVTVTKRRRKKLSNLLPETDYVNFDKFTWYNIMQALKWYSENIYNNMRKCLFFNN